MRQIGRESKFFIVLLAMMSALPPFAIDTYLPSMTVMKAEFMVSSAAMTRTLAFYFIGFAVGLLLWGPLGDRRGRRRVIFIGAVIFVLGSIISAVTPDIELMNAGRFLQGFGDAAAVAMAWAIARDCYYGQALVKVLSVLTMVMLIAPLIAPVIGSVIVSYASWRVVFVFLACYGLLVGVLSRLLPITYRPPDTPEPVWVGYKCHLCNVQLVLRGLGVGLAFAIFFTFASSSSIIYMEHFHLSRWAFVGLFALNTTAIILGNALLRFWLNVWPPARVQLLAIILLTVAIFGMQVWQFVSPTHGVWAFAVPVWLMTVGYALVATSLSAEAMSSANRYFSSASSLVHAFRLVGGASASIAIGYVIDKSLDAFAHQQLVIVLLLWVVFLLLGTSSARVR